MPRRPRTIEVRNIAAAGDIDRYLRRVAGVSRATSHRWRNRRGFPKPVKRTKAVVLWDLAEVRVWVEARLAENVDPYEGF